MTRRYRVLFSLLGVGVILLAGGAWTALNTNLYLIGIIMIAAGGALLYGIAEMAD